MVIVKRADQASYLKQYGYTVGKVNKDHIEILDISSNKAIELLEERVKNFNKKINKNDYERDTRWILYLMRRNSKR